MTTNDLNKKFKPNIERLFKITNKKVIVMGHSYGVKNTYY